MAVVTVDRTKLLDAVQVVATKVADMVRPVADTSTPLPRSEWTVGEAAAHLAWAQETFTRIVRGETVHHGDRTPEGLAQANTVVLNRYTERDGARLADLIVEWTRAYAQSASGAPSDLVVLTPMGTMSVDMCSAYMLTHLMMHGSPIADALHRGQPFGAAEVEQSLAFITYLMPAIVDEEAARGFTACYDVRFRGGPRLALMFDDGQLTIAPAPARRVDCHISADPVAFLRVGSGLVGQWGQIARGRLMTWGRKPWLALKFTSLFHPP
jgi:Mycothiol maleylpyruvate isomerase N-terminal domain